MNEAQIWIIIFLQSIHLAIHLFYMLFSVIVRFLIYRHTTETDNIIKEALNQNSEK